MEDCFSRDRSEKRSLRGRTGEFGWAIADCVEWALLVLLLSGVRAVGFFSDMCFSGR